MGQDGTRSSRTFNVHRSSFLVPRSPISSFLAVKKLRVLILMHDYQVPPDDVSGHDLETVQWKTEYDVLKTLRDDLAHDVHVVGVKDELGGIKQAVEEFKPHIAFNLLEAFHEVG